MRGEKTSPPFDLFRGSKENSGFNNNDFATRISLEQQRHFYLHWPNWNMEFTRGLVMFFMIVSQLHYIG